MSSRIDSNSLAEQRQANTRRSWSRPISSVVNTSRKINRNVAEGIKAAAKAALGGTTDLKKISDSRKLSKPVDELAGIKDLNASYFIHTGADRRVVQLREEKTSKLVRQVPDQHALERLTSMRRYVGRVLDIIV